MDYRSATDTVKIVIADDDDLCRGLIKDSINMNNLDIHLASNGVEALSLVKEKNIDLLITDLNMPQLDGLSLINLSRQINPDIVSIIITGFGSLESAIKAIQQGAYDYVQKPFSVERITVVARNAVEKIRTLKEKSKLLRELETAYQRLKLLESRPQTMEKHEERSETLHPVAKDAYYVLSKSALPLFCYDSSLHSSSRVLSHLERLSELKREGAVSDHEFDALKEHIIKQLRSVS